MFTWLAAAVYAALGIDDAYKTSKVYDNAREDARERGLQYFYGRRGEMYDVVTGIKCKLKHDGKGNAYLVSAKNGRFIRNLTIAERLTERQKALKENRLVYRHDTRGIGACLAKRESSTDRIFEKKYNSDYLSYQKVVDGRLIPDFGRHIPKSAIPYYEYPYDPVPEDIMKEVIEWERKAGIYRE